VLYSNFVGALIAGVVSLAGGFVIVRNWDRMKLS
jgi:hypothetical protein